MKTHLMRAHLVFLLLAGVSAPAFAQAERESAASEGNGGGSDIIVTARRREENLQDVPLAITAISGNELQKRGVTTFTDLQSQVPGLQLTASSRSNSTPTITLRGQRQSDVSPSTDPTVGIYFAELPIARPNGINGSLFDLQSVQVLKGPQGTLFGRNTTGGAVLFTPNAPISTLSAMAQVTFGNYGLHDLEGMVNVPIGDVAKLRVSGKITRRDGYMVDVTSGGPGHRGNDIHNEGIRGYLRITPSASITSDFIVSYFHANDGGSAYKLLAANPAGMPVPALRPAFAAAADKALATGKYEYMGLPYTLNDGTTQGLYSKTESITAQNTTTINISDNMFVKNIFGYRKTSSSGIFELGAMPFTLVRTNAFFDMHQISDELQMQGTGKELNWIVGLFYFREKGSDSSHSNQFSTLETFTSDALIKNTSKSIFGHFDYSPEWLSGLTLAAGIRYTHDDRVTAVKARSPRGSVTTYRCLDGTIISDSFSGEACPRLTANASFNKVTYDVTVNYKLSPDIMVYAAKRRGYRSGALFSRPGSVAALQLPAKPETVDDIEVGLKSTFDLGSGVRAHLNAAYFHSDYKNVQRALSVFINNVLTGAYTNAASAKIDGVEIDGSLALGRSVVLSANYAYLNPRYSKYMDRGSDGSPVDISDSPFAYSPKHTFSINARYNVPIDDRLGQLSVQGTYYWQDKTFGLDNQTANCGTGGVYGACANAGIAIPAYGLVNARLDWENFMGGPVDIGLFVNNLTNKYYFVSKTAQLNPLGVVYGLPGAPRMFGGSVRLHF